MRIASFFAAAAARINDPKRFADDSGASLIEYAMILGLVSLLAVGGFSLLGNQAKVSLTSAGAMMP